MIPYIPETIQVERVEINQCYDDEGKLRMCQAIFWDWHPLDSTYHVRDWCYLDDSRQDRASLLGNRVYLPTPDGGLRVIEGRRLVRTHTQYDPEMEDRRDWPLERRKRILPPHY